MATRHHGITAKEPTSGIIPMTDADTSTIGLLAFADDADADFFPFDTPVLVTSISKAISKAGTTGNLRRSLENIASIISPTMIVVRIKNPLGNEVINQALVIGENSQPRTGLNAFLTAKSITSLTPKIIVAPNVETPSVTQTIIAICKKLRAFAYITPRDRTGNMLGTQQAVVAYRNTLDSRDIMLIWPEWTSGNVLQQASANTDTNEASNTDSSVTFIGNLSNGDGFWEVTSKAVKTSESAKLYQKVYVGSDNENNPDTDSEFAKSFVLTKDPDFTYLSNLTSVYQALTFEWVSEAGSSMPSIELSDDSSPVAFSKNEVGFTITLAGK